MQAAGITTVRIGEFAWHVIQSENGAPYNFSLFDAALTVLSSHGIGAIFGTPTASPPAWFIGTNAPELQLVNFNGDGLRYGSRQNINHLNKEFLLATSEIVSAIGTHYGNDSRIIAFQIDNEIQGQEDYSALTGAAFQVWLLGKYSTIEALNVAWGTVFWSHSYNAFDEVPLPWLTLGSGQGQGQACANPGLLLDYRRFIATVATEYLSLQANILRDKAPGKRLTHNCMGTYANVDYSTFGAQLDYVAFDNYPLSWWSGAPVNYYDLPSESIVYGPALAAAFMRGAKGQDPFFIMEQQVANTGQSYYYGSGFTELWRLCAWQMVANGADGVQFFRWRTTRVGFEQHWEGILNWDGATGTRRYASVQLLGTQFAAASAAVTGARVRARVAILNSPDTRWTLLDQVLTEPGVAVEPQMANYLAAFRANRVGVDVIYVTDVNAIANLSRYEIVLAPTLLILPDALAAALEAYVTQGGVLLLSMRSGTKTVDNAYTAATLPGAVLSPMAGIALHEWDPLCSLGESTLTPAAAAAVAGGAAPPPPGSPFPISTSQGRLCEVLEPLPGALASGNLTILATYTGGYYAGYPAISLNKYGAGEVLYVGTVSDEGSFHEWIAGLLAGSAGVPFGPRLPFGLELCIRDRADGSGPAIFLLNFAGSDANVTVAEAAGGLDVLAGTTVPPSGVLLVPARDLRVISVSV